jgi:hypothetical protein
MNRDELFKLYEIVIHEEHYFLESHQNRVAFYSSLQSALVAGIAVGLLQGTQWYHFLILCIGPILLYIVANSAVSGTSRLYQRYLETVTTRAKIEQELSLTVKQNQTEKHSEGYWKAEPFISFRHIENRQSTKSSDEFIKSFSSKGNQKITLELFRAFNI